MLNQIYDSVGIPNRLRLTSSRSKLTIDPQTGGLDFTVELDGWPEDQQPVHRYVGHISKEKVVLEKDDLGDGHGFFDIRKPFGELGRTSKAGIDLPTCE